MNEIKAFYLFFGFPISFSDDVGPALIFSGQLNPISRYAILCFISPVSVHKIAGKHNIGSGECTCVLSEHLWYIDLKILNIEYSRYRVAIQGNDDFVYF